MMHEHHNKCDVVDLCDKYAYEDTRRSQRTTSMKGIIGSSDVKALKQESREKIIALEEGKRLLQMERDELRHEIARLKALGEPTAKMQTMNAQNPEADFRRQNTNMRLNL